MGMGRALTSYVPPLSKVNYFKCLGRVLAEEDKNGPEVVCNLWYSRQNWARPTQILIKEGADDRT